MLSQMADIGEKIIKFIAVALLILITVLMLFYQNNIVMNITEASVVTKNNWSMLLFVIVLMVLYGCVCILLKRISASCLFVVLAAIYLVGGLYIITHIYMTQICDAGMCYNNAKLMLEGDYRGFLPGEYFYEHPHQLGLLLYDCILILVCNKVNFIYCVNLIWVLGGIFFLWHSVNIQKDDVLVAKITVLFAFTFFPQFLFIFFAYGLVPGLGCLLASLYFASIYMKNKKMIWQVMSLLFIAFACLVRTNYTIAGIAMIIILILSVFREDKQSRWRGVVVIISLIFALTIPKILLNKGFELITHADLSQGMPMSLYVAMGLQEDDVRAAGWYSGFNHDTYIASGCDVEVSSMIAKKAIEERLDFFVNNPREAFEFFSEKIITTWCEPTYQSVWSGPLIGVTGKTDVLWLQEFYSGGDNYNVFSFVMNGINIIILGFAAFALLWNLFKEKRSIGSLNLFCVLFFVGGFLFHLIWETKSQYVYPYVVCLLPVTARGAKIIYFDIVSAYKHQKIEK